MPVVTDSSRDPEYIEYLRQLREQQIQQQQQEAAQKAAAEALAQQQAQDQAAADAAAQAAAEKKAQSFGGYAKLDAADQAESQMEFAKLQQQQQAISPPPSVESVGSTWAQASASKAGSTAIVPKEIQSAKLPEGYAVKSWEQTSGGYKVQLRLDEQLLLKAGGELTSQGAYRFDNGEIPGYLQGTSFGDKFQKDAASGAWEDKLGNDVDYWELKADTGELTAYFKQGSAGSVNPYAEFGEGQYFNDKAIYGNVDQAGGIGTDPTIIDPTQKYVPVSAHIMSSFNDLAKAQGDAIFIPSQFSDIEGAGGIGTDPMQLGSTHVTKAQAISGIGQFAAGGVASIESLYLGGAVPSVWGAGMEQVQIGLGQRADAPMGAWLAEHPGYALGNIAGEVVQAVVVGEAMKALTSPGSGMVRVRGYDEIPTSFRTKQELTIGGRSYTRLSDVEQAGKIEFRGKAFDVPAEDLYRVKAQDLTDARGNPIGFEVMTEQPGGSLTSVYRGTPKEKYIYNSADMVDLDKNAFNTKESWMREGLTEDLLKENKAIKLDNLEGGLLKEQYEFSKEVPYKVASGRAGLGDLPTNPGIFSPTTSYYGDIAKAGKAAGAADDLAKSSKAAEKIMGAVDSKGAQAAYKGEQAGKGSGSPVQTMLRQESDLQGLSQGSKYLTVQGSGAKTWAGLYVGAKAAYDMGQEYYQGAKPGEIPDVSQPVRIGIDTGSDLKIGIAPIIKPPIDLPGTTTPLDKIIPISTDPLIEPPIVVPKIIPGITEDQDIDTPQITIPIQISDELSVRNAEVMMWAAKGRRSPRREEDPMAGLFGRKGRMKYEERLNPFKSSLEMPSGWGRGRSKGKRARRGSGLLWAIGAALASLFALYLISSLMLPVIGMLDWQVLQFMNNPNIAFSSTWTDEYNTLIPFLKSSFTYLIWGTVFAVIMFVVIQANRREPNEYQG